MRARSGGAGAPLDARDDAERCRELRSGIEAALKDSRAAARRATEAYESIARWPAATASLARVECLLAITQAHHLGADPAAAAASAQRAVSLARVAHEPALLRKALTFLGVSLVEDGMLPEAVQCYAEALQLATTLQDPLAQSSVWNNLGLALRSAAMYAEARPCFERAVAVAGDTPETLLPLRAA